MIPFALGKMIAVNPTIAVILLLVSAHGRGKALAYVIGALLGPLIAGFLLLPLVGTVVPPHDDDGPSPFGSALQLVIGLTFVFLAIRGWRRRTAKDLADATPPGWMRALDRVSVGGALVLGAVMTVFGVKNLLMLTGLVVVIGETDLDIVQVTIVLVAFVLLSTLPIATPLIAAKFLGPRADVVLSAWKAWLVRDTDLIMLGFLGVIGGYFTYQGVVGLVATGM